MFGTACKLPPALFALLALTAASVGAEPMRERKEKTLLETTRAVYSVFQKDTEVGTETVTRYLYNDNTIVYKATVKLEMSSDTSIDQESELVLEEESRFPRSYRLDKSARNAEMIHEIQVTVEMFANVARSTTEVQGHVVERIVVLPAGTPLMSVDVVHPIYQLLFWYDREKGGRQAFQVLEVMRNRPDDVVLELRDRQSVSVGGELVETDVYVLHWTSHAVSYFVDGEGRVVAANLGFLRAELVEWTSWEEG